MEMEELELQLLRSAALKTKAVKKPTPSPPPSTRNPTTKVTRFNLVRYKLTACTQRVYIPKETAQRTMNVKKAATMFDRIELMKKQIALKEKAAAMIKQRQGGGGTSSADGREESNTRVDVTKHGQEEKKAEVETETNHRKEKSLAELTAEMDALVRERTSTQLLVDQVRQSLTEAQEELKQLAKRECTLVLQQLQQTKHP